jgi:hypothetical protein
MLKAFVPSNFTYSTELAANIKNTQTAEYQLLNLKIWQKQH